MKIHNIIKNTIILGTLLSFTGCYIESHESDDDEPRYPHDMIPSPVYGDIPDNYMLVADLCETDTHKVQLSEGTKKKLCFENKDYEWNTTCRGGKCQAVPVYVQYMLSEDLGASRTVTIEAFDNPHFGGTPISTVTIQNFTAQKAGQFQQASLYLGTGTYYARAYIAKSTDTVVPYEYADMQLVENKPMGVLGALSSPATINVTNIPESDRQPFYITIDKLFRKPGQKEDTKAHVRLNLSLAKGSSIENDRNIFIQLLDEDDIQVEPKYQFKIPSASLNVAGRKGQTEFISESLEIGSYYIFVFADENGNGYYDSGEVASYYGRDQSLKPFTIRARRTGYLALELSDSGGVELK